MKIDEMNLEQVTARLAELDEEVRSAKEVEAVNKATEEKKELLTRKAELEALEQRKQTALDITAGKVDVKVIEERKVEKPMEFKGYDSPEYRSAFLKSLQGNPLSETEKREFSLVPNTAGAVVPTQTANMIFDNMTKIAPMLNEIQLLRVAGNLRFAVQGVRNAAAVHAENAPVAPAADTMVTVTLTGFEFIKVVRISATIQTMAIDAFETWIAKIIGEDLAVVIDNEIINGGSVAGNIAAAQDWADNVNQVTYVPANGLAYNNLTTLIGLLPSAFDANAKFVMRKSTFYTQVLGMADANGNPIAVPDIASPGRYSILGYPVLIDDNVTANEAYLGDFKQVVGNLSSDIRVDRSTESGFLNNSIDFRGTAIFDCDIAQPTAIVKLNV